MDKVIASYMDIRKKLNVSSFFSILKEMDAFEVAKTKTLDVGFETIQRLRKEGVKPEEFEARKRSLNLNILEAVSTDHFAGRKDNAKAGFALVLNPLVNLTKDEKTDALHYLVVEDWA